MKRRPDGDPRRAALKELVPYAHLMANSYGEILPALALELRRLANFLDAVATDGDPSQLAALFGLSLMR